MAYSSKKEHRLSSFSMMKCWWVQSCAGRVQTAIASVQSRINGHVIYSTPSQPLTLKLFPPLPCCSLNLREGCINVLFRTKYSTVISSHHFDQLWVWALTVIYAKYKLLCPMLREIQIYEHRKIFRRKINSKSIYRSNNSQATSKLSSVLHPGL